MAGGEVHDHHRDQKRADAARSSLGEDGGLLLHRAEPADSRAHDDADTFRILERDGEAGVADGLVGGDHGELLEPRHAPLLLTVDGLRGIEVIDVAADAGRVLGDVEVRERVDAGASRRERLPHRLGAYAHRAYDADAGDDDASHARIPSSAVPASLASRYSATSRSIRSATVGMSCTRATASPAKTSPPSTSPVCALTSLSMMQ